MLVLTTFDLDEYVYEALQAGASGFLLKDTPPGPARAAVRAVAAGETLLAPAVTRRLIEEFAAPPARPARAPRQLDDLTPREFDVLRHLARGLSNAEIAAAALPQRHHRQDPRRPPAEQLGLRDRVQAVVLAYESGLVTPGRPDA